MPPPTVQPVGPQNIAHIHHWKWTQEPDGIFALWVQTRFVSCVHLFDLKVVPAGGSPFPVCGMGGIATEGVHRGKGHARMLLEDVIRQYSKADVGVRGFLLNGIEAPCLWGALGFRDVGASHTRPAQRLWWLPARPGVQLPTEFAIEPRGFHW